MTTFSPISIQDLRHKYDSGQLTPTQLIDSILGQIEERGNDAVWIHRLTREQILAQIEQIELWKREGWPLPLYGIPFAIKDNLDLADHPTTAACPAFSYIPTRSATVVTKLQKAGAILIGKTNLDQFATGLVGVRSPYGAPRSVFNNEYISGGSSSGSAVAVAAGLVAFSLGTDTAGSGRVPASFNNIVGLKPTRGLVSTAGVLPACKSLDCVSIFARDCTDARTVLEVMEGPDEWDPWSRVKPATPATLPDQFTFGVPRPDQLQFFGDEEAEKLFSQALDRMKEMGGKMVEVDFAPFREAALLLYAGPWVAERMAAVGEDFFAKHAQEIHPVVRQIVEGANKFNAVQAFQGIYRLQELRSKTEPVWKKIDFMILPTAGTIYKVEEVERDPVQLNSNLGYYTNFMNLLDLSGLALPAGFRPNGLPFGFTLVAPAFWDEALLKFGQGWEQT